MLKKKSTDKTPEKNPATPEQSPPNFVHNYTPMEHRENRLEQHNADHTRTERAGFVPMEKRIQAIMQSGQRLDKARREQYHFGQGEVIDGDFVDSAPNHDIDLADIPDIVHHGTSVLQDNHDKRKIAAEKTQLAKEKALKDAIKEAAKSAKEELPKPADVPPADGESPAPTA